MTLPVEATLADLHRTIGEPLGLGAGGRCVLVVMDVPEGQAVASFGLGSTRFARWRVVDVTSGDDHLRGVVACDPEGIAAFDHAVVAASEAAFADCGAIRIVNLVERDADAPDEPIPMGVSHCTYDAPACAREVLRIAASMAVSGTAAVVLTSRDVSDC